MHLLRRSRLRRTLLRIAKREGTASLSVLMVFLPKFVPGPDISCFTSELQAGKNRSRLSAGGMRDRATKVD